MTLIRDLYPHGPSTERQLSAQMKTHNREAAPPPRARCQPTTLPPTRSVNVTPLTVPTLPQRQRLLSSQGRQLKLKLAGYRLYFPSDSIFHKFGQPTTNCFSQLRQREQAS